MKTSPPIVELAHEAMATTFQLRLAGTTEKLARQAAAAAWGELARLESLLSRYIDGSDVSRINCAPPGDPVRVNADTMECLTAAMNMANLTGGAFDPMMGAWTGAGNRVRPNPKPRPAGDTIPALNLNEADMTTCRTHEDFYLDLGGVGKGFAIDKLAAVLREWDVPAASIDAGGSAVFAFGRPRANSPWEAQIATHRISLEDASIAGSGTSVKGNHIIDGRTGATCAHQVRVWSCAPTASEADALSTAFFAFSASDIEAFCARHPCYGAARLDRENNLEAFGVLGAQMQT